MLKGEVVTLALSLGDLLEQGERPARRTSLSVRRHSDRQFVAEAARSRVVGLFGVQLRQPERDQMPVRRLTIRADALQRAAQTRGKKWSVMYWPLIGV